MVETAREAATGQVASAIGARRLQRHIRGIGVAVMLVCATMGWSSVVTTSKTELLRRGIQTKTLGSRENASVYSYHNPEKLNVSNPNPFSTLLTHNNSNMTHDNGRSNLKHAESLSLENKENDLAHQEDAPLAPFWPVRVMDQYMRWHSVQTLEREYQSSNTKSDRKYRHRKFAIVYYWCPERAGNILHNMFITMTWAIITNRTILVKYDNHSNTEQDCQDVLKRADWIPRYDDWVLRMDLIHPPVPIPIDVHRLQYDEMHQTVIFPQIPDLAETNQHIVRQQWRDDPLNRKEFRSYLLEMGAEQKTIAGKLYNNGVNFLFGMLFRETFTLQDAYAPASAFPDSSGLTIALHSRHIVVGDDGSFVPSEMKCLQSLIKKLSGRTESNVCRVYLMSDRQETISILSQWLRQRNCTPISVTHGEQGVVMRSEHGPWTGIGFLQDLASTSLARTAVVGDVRRSSFMLLVELIEYDRLIQAWKEGKSEISDLEICELPNKSWSGYDYGPGTPTFRHHSRIPPLPPIQVLENYKTSHSLENLSRDTGVRKFALASLSCASAIENQIHQLLNGTSKPSRKTFH